MNHTNENEWARTALRTLLARCIRALEDQAAYELALVLAARQRLGL